VAIRNFQVKKNWIGFERNIEIYRIGGRTKLKIIILSDGWNEGDTAAYRKAWVG
jgi:hypothetical protein